MTRWLSERDEARETRLLGIPAESSGEYELTPSSDMGPDHISSSGDMWVLHYDGAQDGAVVGQTDQRSTPPTSIRPGRSSTATMSSSGTACATTTKPARSERRRSHCHTSSSPFTSSLAIS